MKTKSTEGKVSKVSKFRKIKRATVYFDPDVHRALRHKAAAAEITISDLVNDAVRLSLKEDAEDMSAFERRRREPSLSFESVVKDLKRRGKL
ncbi:MAG TPA: hypothetical protein VMN39_00670 [Longimicrobiaceae bacterium]|nr:hypothetical protein [Longimicrobiaceae bacterium]